MGNASRIVLVGASTLLVGIYSVSLKRAQLTDIQAADLIGRTAQVERITDAALRVAVYRVQANVKMYRDSLKNNIALSIAPTSPRQALGGGTYTYNLYVPWGQYYATGTVTVSPPNEQSKTLTVRVDRVNWTGSTVAGTNTGTKPGYHRAIRGQWQMTSW
jgi:hypothetical protein